MTSEFRDLQLGPADAHSLFRRVLGEAWDLLPPPIKQLHSTTSVSKYSGLCTVRQGRNPVARAVAALVGFPDSGNDLPIDVKFSVENSGERWVRTVTDRTFSSMLSLPKGRSESLVRERFGPMAVDMALVVEAKTMNYVIRRWRLLGVPMPLWLGPKTIATESVDAHGRFRFDIEIRHPFIGLLVHYAGWLRAGH